MSAVAYVPSVPAGAFTSTLLLFRHFCYVPAFFLRRLDAARAQHRARVDQKPPEASAVFCHVFSSRTPWFLKPPGLCA